MEEIQTNEKQELMKMLQLEDLAGKKAKIYARLLTDIHLSEEMQGLALRHEERKELLAELLGRKVNKKQNEGACPR